MTNYQLDQSSSGSHTTLRPSVRLSAMNPSSAARAIDVVASPNVTSVVFVVDDEESVRESLELLMRTEGWRVESFASATDFMSRPRAPVPCCLVLDVRLRGHSGLELQRQLAGQIDIPIIFITGYGDI